MYVVRSVTYTTEKPYKGPNPHQVSACGTFVRIRIPSGEEILVDSEDYPKVELFRWFRASRRPYAHAHVRGADGRRHQIQMHRLIMNPPANLVIDHIDGDPKNNRKSNLRVCTQAENSRNQRSQKSKASRWRGVSMCKSTGRWQVAIRVGGTRVWGGRFSDEIEAAQAYNQLAITHHGQFARLNEVAQC